MIYSTIAVTGNVKVSTWKLSGTVRIGSVGAVYPVYEGDTVITPTEDTQVLETDGYLLVDDIVVNPIPSNYIDTTDATGTSGSQILSPYTFYANGQKIQGTAELATATVEGNTLVLTNGFPVEVI